jgi:hypothetical protein
MLSISWQEISARTPQHNLRSAGNHSIAGIILKIDLTAIFLKLRGAILTRRRVQPGFCCRFNFCSGPRRD